MVLVVATIVLGWLDVDNAGDIGNAWVLDIDTLDDQRTILGGVSKDTETCRGKPCDDARPSLQKMQRLHEHGFSGFCCIHFGRVEL